MCLVKYQYFRVDSGLFLFLRNSIGPIVAPFPFTSISCQKRRNYADGSPVVSLHHQPPKKLSIIISCRVFSFQTGWIEWLENWLCFGNECGFYKIDKCKSWSQMSTNTVLIGYLEEIRSIWLIPKKVTLFQDNFKSCTAPSSSSCPETRAFADLGCLWMGIGTFLNCFSFWGWLALSWGWNRPQFWEILYLILENITCCQIRSPRHEGNHLVIQTILVFTKYTKLVLLTFLCNFERA